MSCLWWKMPIYRWISWFFPAVNLHSWGFANHVWRNQSVVFEDRLHMKKNMYQLLTLPLSLIHFIVILCDSHLVCGYWRFHSHNACCLSWKTSVKWNVESWHMDRRIAPTMMIPEATGGFTTGQLLVNFPAPGLITGYAPGSSSEMWRFGICRRC